ncbi:MAG TPA: hypothetical protein VJ726_09255 [Candidatus Limnocylindria bacterium]|nr:hypothetical protein [Candidatus Limnocylindria bacterium]
MRYSQYNTVIKRWIVLDLADEGYRRPAGLTIVSFGAATNCSQG